MRDEFEKIETRDDLVKCHSCGSQAELWEYSHSGHFFEKVVCCSNGGGDLGIPDCPMYLPSQGFYKSTEIEAIEIWNQRSE